jgi:transcription antitermination factor NusG
MKLLDPKHLREDEQVMLETARAQSSVPSFYVRTLLQRLQETRQNAQPQSKFKVGDWVRVVPYNQYTGRSGRVEHLLPYDEVAVKFEGQYTSQVMQACNLELITPPLKVGDRVRLKDNFGGQSLGK